MPQDSRVVKTLIKKYSPISRKYIIHGNASLIAHLEYSPESERLDLKPETSQF